MKKLSLDSDIMEYNTDKPKLILFQGPSGAGKTTVTKFLCQELIKNGIKSEVINFDNYAFATDPKKTITGDYNFNCPSAYDWDGLRKLLVSYGKKEDFVERRIYNFETESVIITKQKNNKPDVLILEGFLIFNLVNEKIFNIEKSCSLNHSMSVKDNCNVPNPIDFSIYFNIYKIFFELEESDIKKMRFIRYFNERKSKPQLKNLCESDMKKFIEKELEKFVIPSTKSWVNYGKESADLIVKCSPFSHNRDLNEFIKEFIEYFCEDLIDTEINNSFNEYLLSNR
ncbi:hypothetical protein A0H76_298 [Hepatospora eriocheir]|uniref:Phosphoribulokinase/uridine kinase domain-containing protein n=1 Tax=Hepatospora eriocheir TaxID=1081669 RepID=A0A1X0QIZ3_9MICR|nr:hypothetical protein A0H76_298 [Hepatospora eriocheir]